MPYHFDAVVMILGNDLAGRAGGAGATSPQSPVVVSWQLAFLEQEESDLGYLDGFSVCPIVLLPDLFDPGVS